MSSSNDSGSNVTPTVGVTQPIDDLFSINKNELISHALVSDVLVGRTNYVPWKKSMEIAFSARSKLGFIRGEYPKPDDAQQALKWQRCNDVIMSWLICSVSKNVVGQILHAKDVTVAWKNLTTRYASSNLSRKFELQQDISNLVQGEMEVAAYFEKLINLWQELDSMKVRKQITESVTCMDCPEVV